MTETRIDLIRWDFNFHFFPGAFGPAIGSTAMNSRADKCCSFFLPFSVISLTASVKCKLFLLSTRYSWVIIEKLLSMFHHSRA